MTLRKKTLQGLNWFSLEETILDNSLQWRLKIEVMAIFCPLCPQNILFTIGGRIARFMGCAAYLSTLNSDHQLGFDQWSLIKSGMITAQCWGRLNWRVGRCLSDLRNGSLAVGSTRIINGEITKLLNSEFFWFFLPSVTPIYWLRATLGWIGWEPLGWKHCWHCVASLDWKANAESDRSTLSFASLLVSKYQNSTLFSEHIIETLLMPKETNKQSYVMLLFWNYAVCA